jgi:Arc/MetJ-type ribon-helix-helix transcriptional regulator
MIQAKVSLSESQAKFVDSYQELGFKDKSSLVREAIDKMQEDILQKSLEESAQLYKTLYEEDGELQELTESGMEDWPND